MISQYSLASEEWSSTVTPVVSTGVADPDFPVANLQNGNLADPFKFTGTSGALDFDRGSSLPFGLMSLLHTNLSGATVTIKRSDAADFSTGETSTVTLPAIDQDRYYDNPVLDLSSATARRYVRLTITGNADVIILGGLWFSSATHALARGFIATPAPTFGDLRPRVAPLRTSSGVKMGTASFGRMRFIAGTIKGTPTELDAVRDLERSQDGETTAFLFVPDATVNSAWYVELASGVGATQPLAEHRDWSKSGDYPLWQSQMWGVRELARGRPWGDV